MARTTATPQTVAARLRVGFDKLASRLRARGKSAAAAQAIAAATPAHLPHTCPHHTCTTGAVLPGA